MIREVCYAVRHGAGGGMIMAKKIIVETSKDKLAQILVDMEDVIQNIVET